MSMRSRLPEETDFQDTGCELAPRCLACPFPSCRYDDYGAVRRAKYEAIRAAAAGTPRAALATRFGVSKRTIQRALAGPVGSL